MVDFISEQIRFSHLERDNMQKAYKTKAAIDFRAYISSLIRGYLKKQDFDDGEFLDYTKKVLKSLETETARLEKKKQEFETIANDAHTQFANIDSQDDVIKKSKSSKEIEMTNDEALTLVDVAYDDEKKFYYQQGVCSEIDKFIKNFGSQIGKSQNDNITEMLSSMSECLSAQRDSELNKKKELEQKFYDAESKALTKIDDLIFLLRQSDEKERKL